MGALNFLARNIEHTLKTVYLANSKLPFVFIFNDWTIDEASLTGTVRHYFVETVEEAPEEDWKTALVRGIKPIPKGIKLEVKTIMDNFYGRWLEVSYNDWNYSIDPKRVKYLGYEKRKYSLLDDKLIETNFIEFKA